MFSCVWCAFVHAFVCGVLSCVCVGSQIGFVETWKHIFFYFYNYIIFFRERESECVHRLTHFLVILIIIF